MLYSEEVESNRHKWQGWAQSLHRWGVQAVVASLIEAAGPLTFLGAQVIYFSQPIFDGLDRHGHLKALANMLEDTHESQAFVQYLREVSLP